MNRRSFIQNSAATAAFVGFSDLAFGSQLADVKPSNAAKFKLKYAPGFGMFPELCGKDIIDNIKFCSDQGFRAMFDNGFPGRSVEDQDKIEAQGLEGFFLKIFFEISRIISLCKIIGIVPGGPV